MNDTNENGDATLKARILSKMDRKGFYDPRSVRVENLPNIVPCETAEAGRVKSLAHEMAADDSEPVIYSTIGETVMLEVDSEDWVVARIRYHDENALEAGQGDDLRIL